jgi:spore coat polysaccharide biosynthesis predicted glycosyltransferase SpsG
MKAGRKILFVCEANSSVGFGHLVRTRVLAAALRRRGVASILYGPSQALAVPADRSVFAHWIERPAWTSSRGDAMSVASLCRRYDVAQVVVDDYRADLDYQRVLQSAGLDWMQQYDASRKQHFLGRVVVNASPYEKAEYYAGAAEHPGVRFLLGPRYAILRDEFAGVVPLRVNQRTGNVFVSFGGGSDRGAIRKTVEPLLEAGFDGIRFIVMSGGSNPLNPELRCWANRFDARRLQFYVSPPNVPDLMSLCDLAILGGGTTTYEAARCGLPMVLVTLAENQHGQSLGWESSGAAVHAGRVDEIESSEFVKLFSALLGDEERRNRMSVKAAGLVDNNGASRLLNALFEETEL